MKKIYTIIWWVMIILLFVVVILQSNTIDRLRYAEASRFFTEAKASRTETTVRTLTALKSVIDDNNASLEAREMAAKKYNEVTLESHSEVKIENILQGNGFDEVICSIENGRVRIILNSRRKPSKMQIAQIKDIIQSVAKISEVEINLRK